MASSKKVEFEINPLRLQYLLDLYKLSKGDFLSLINNKIKRDIVSVESLNRILDKKEKVNETILKRIDKVFEKGITWYITKRKIHDIKKSSIFFRKDVFNSEIKFESIKVVNKYEELSRDIQALGHYINFDPTRKIKKYKLSGNPEDAARQIFSIISGVENELVEKGVIQKVRQGDNRGFLKKIIRIFECLNIFVFEHLEMPRKKDKVNFNGFFINPNIIVIKKQEYIRREIFTLLHEFAHYILELEEIDDFVGEKMNYQENKVEQWCSTFTFHFLLNDYKNDFNNLGKATRSNNYHKEIIRDLYKNTFLSYSAFYTRLLIEGKISRKDYHKINEEINQTIEKNREEKKNRLKKENEKRIAMGKQPSHPVFKPIESHLFKELVKINYFEGNISESSLRGYLKIKPEKSIKEAIY
jgi:Zn-dependent peptidase ImmA (M78 family)